jgi:hypothetical protein
VSGGLRAFPLCAGTAARAYSERRCEHSQKFERRGAHCETTHSTFFNHERRRLVRYDPMGNVLPVYTPKPGERPLPPARTELPAKTGARGSEKAANAA